MKRLAIAFLASALFALGISGCKSNCRQLSERVCDCALNTLERDECMRRAARADADPRYAPTPEQDAHCGELLPGCDCHLLDTTDGKKRCGLAR